MKNIKQYARGTTTVALCGIKFFYETTLKRDWSVLGLVRPPHEAKLPAANPWRSSAPCPVSTDRGHRPHDTPSQLLPATPLRAHANPLRRDSPRPRCRSQTVQPRPPYPCPYPSTHPKMRPVPSPGHVADPAKPPRTVPSTPPARTLNPKRLSPSAAHSTLGCTSRCGDVLTLTSLEQAHLTCCVSGEV
jgi:hypothetical protein